MNVYRLCTQCCIHVKRGAGSYLLAPSTTSEYLAQCLKSFFIHTQINRRRFFHIIWIWPLPIRWKSLSVRLSAHVILNKNIQNRTSQYDLTNLHTISFEFLYRLSKSNYKKNSTQWLPPFIGQNRGVCHCERLCFRYFFCLNYMVWRRFHFSFFRMSTYFINL